MKVVSAIFSASLLLACVSCSTAEQDGRKYYSPTSPVQGRMGVQFKRVRADVTPDSQPQSAAAAEVKDDSLLGNLGMKSSVENQPPGLLDRNEKPDEPGAQYWMHGQQSANPVQSRMGIQVSRRKKDPTAAQ